MPAATTSIIVRRFPTRSAIGAATSPAPAGARMTLMPEEGTGDPVYIPYAPRQVNVDGLAGQFATIERVSQLPALVYDRPSLNKISFQLAITDKLFANSGGTRRTAKQTLDLLKSYAKAGTRMRVTYSSLEAGSWRITALTFQTLTRDERTNEVTQATVSMELTQASEMVVNVGPVTGGAQQPTVTQPVSTTHLTKAGDTLWDLAMRYYGDGNKWTVIGDANNIVDPRRMATGIVLRIPAV